MLDLIGAIAGLAAVAINLVAIASVLPLSLAQRIALAAGVGAWVGLSTGLAAAGQFSSLTGPPVPLVGVLFAAPLIAFAAAWAGSAGLRRMLLAIPMPLLIGLNSIRMLGALFLILAAVGRLSGPFPVSAGWGDVITGALALPVALIAARGSLRLGGLIGLWNLFGIADLVAAMTLGVISANGSPLQLIFAGAGSEAMQHLPFALVPTVLVPFFLMTHAVIAAQLAARRRPALAPA